ncbi:MAG: hypothetical protein IPP07_29155 [Holophagales bacterium]|nr:hypothetical protein [Holophagales bacterium]
MRAVDDVDAGDGTDAADDRTNQSVPRATQRSDAARAGAVTGLRRAETASATAGAVTGRPDRTAFRARRHGTQERV